MAVTRLKRKDRRNKTVSRDRKHVLKSFAALSFTKPVHYGVHAEPETPETVVASAHEEPTVVANHSEETHAVAEPTAHSVESHESVSEENSEEA